MKSLIFLLYLLWLYEAVFFVSAQIPNKVPLVGSYGHKNHGLEKKSNLDPKQNLTLTIVTGSWSNTKKVSSYYSSFKDLTLKDQTEMHVKIQASVASLSQVFNTSFIEYQCPNEKQKLLCFASSSEVTIPVELKSAILSILGLEQILTFKPNVVLAKRVSRHGSNLKTSSNYDFFIPSDVAKIYNFPNSNGAGTRIGIVSLGGYFDQSDLQDYFAEIGLDTPPTINLMSVDGAQMNYDANGILENYLDIEIISSLVPNATINLFFAPNTIQGLYDGIYFVLKMNDVASLSWATNEDSGFLSYLSSFQALFEAYSNVPIFVATGDQGAAGGVGFPAVCPNAIGFWFFN